MSTSSIAGDQSILNERLAQRSGIQIFLTAVIFAIFLFLVSPSIISTQEYLPAWDDQYLLHRAICVHNSFEVHSFWRFCDCYSILTKSPLMTLLTIPWGTAGGTDLGIGLSLVSLGVLIWILSIVSFYLLVRLRIQPVIILLAGASIFLNPFLGGYGGSYLADILVSWAITVAFLLIPMELTTEKASLWGVITRGFLWALVINLGLLSKVTFGYFIPPIGLILLWLRYRNQGRWRTVGTVASAAAGSVPCIFIWALFGKQFIQHAYQASFGSYAQAYADPNGGLVNFAGKYLSAIGHAWIPVLLLACVFVWQIRRVRGYQLAVVTGVFLSLVFFAICGVSRNQDLRFAMPVMIGLPFAFAAATKPGRFRLRSNSALLLAGALACIIWSFQMIARPNLSTVREALQLLEETGQAPAARILLITDHPTLNIETFLLAKEISKDRYRSVSIDTTVYDAINGRSLESSYKKIEQSDYVIAHKPPLSSEPAFANQNAEIYRAHALKAGTQQPSSSRLVEVYKIRH
jgi:hypothetical protein